MSPFPAAAHLTPNSEITLSIAEDAVSAEIIVPQGEYGYATGNPTGNKPAALEAARRYLSEHFAVTAPDGRRWAITFETLAFEHIVGPPDLHARARLTPPPGGSPREFHLKWSALLAELPSHFALVVLASDSGGVIGQRREIIGALRGDRTAIAIDRGPSRAGFVLANSMLLGFEHILEGYDHLLFLLALLLPAPLIASGGRWRGLRGRRDTIWHLLRVVTAFTIGHSLTLIAATLGGWSLPVVPVEIAIAVSVLLSAVHAMRPLLPGREQLVAVVFGLVHGLAFATLLQEAGVGAGSAAVSLLGFNLGIELAQLAIVALVMPPLVMMAASPLFGIIRTTLAGLTAFAALAWIANRSLGLGNGLVAALETAFGQGLWGVAALYLAVIWIRMRSAASGPHAHRHPAI